MSDQTEGPIGRIHTLAEAAEYLRMTRHTIAKVARKTGFCTVAGRDLRFTDDDLRGIWNSMRCPPADGMPISSEHAYASLLARVIERKQNKTRSRRKLGN